MSYMKYFAIIFLLLFIVSCGVQKKKVQEESTVTENKDVIDTTVTKHLIVNKESTDSSEWVWKPVCDTTSLTVIDGDKKLILKGAGTLKKINKSSLKLNNLESKKTEVSKIEYVSRKSVKVKEKEVERSYIWWILVPLTVGAFIYVDWTRE